MNCLWCMEDLTTKLSWTDFLTLKKPTSLCHTCYDQLRFLTGSRCTICDRETVEKRCSDCVRWQQIYAKDPLTRNYSIFAYNTFIQDIIAKWKYRGDYIVGEMFQPFIIKKYSSAFAPMKQSFIAVPIPLSDERLNERKFNQAEMLAQFLPIKLNPVLQRIGSEKQAKKSRKERMTAKNPFTITGEIQKPAILVDDIYTTGTTLRHAASCLLENGCPEVYALTLIRG